MANFEPGRMVVFLREWHPENGPSGPVLYAENPFKLEVGQTGDDVGDLFFEGNTLLRGLLIFEGWIEVGPGEDPDVTCVGEWRKLTHWEMCKVREGRAPWELDPYGH